MDFDTENVHEDQSDDELSEQKSEPDWPNDDSLLRITIPDAVRKVSSEINEAARSISERIKSISASSEERIERNNQRQAQSYVEARRNLADDLANRMLHICSDWSLRTATKPYGM